MSMPPVDARANGSYPQGIETFEAQTLARMRSLLFRLGISPTANLALGEKDIVYLPFADGRHLEIVHHQGQRFNDGSVHFKLAHPAEPSNGIIWTRVDTLLFPLSYFSMFEVGKRHQGDDLGKAGPMIDVTEDALRETSGAIVRKRLTENLDRIVEHGGFVFARSGEHNGLYLQTKTPDPDGRELFAIRDRGTGALQSVRIGREDMRRDEKTIDAGDLSHSLTFDDDPIGWDTLPIMIITMDDTNRQNPSNRELLTAAMLENIGTDVAAGKSLRFILDAVRITVEVRNSKHIPEDRPYPLSVAASEWLALSQRAV